jgi:hypothetical protein
LTWTLKKWALSLFVTGHVAALLTWNLPNGPLRAWLEPTAAHYILPTGLWQSWCMFAPDPPRAKFTLEAVIIDKNGVARIYPFPYSGEMSPLEKVPLYRHAKYASNVGVKESKAQREFAARHALRSLDIPDDAYPVDLQLYYKVRPTPPPGTPSEERTLHTENSLVETYRFPNRQEALP